MAVPGSAWRGPIMVDSLDQGPGDAQAADRGAYGCARPAPSVAIDQKYGYVHVAYALTGPEGPGVFYAHQMDPRSQFEPPVAILYGERIGDARVAVDGEVVAVAYEDPNSGLGRRKIGLAVSRTSGHLFEDRLTASGPISNARDPHDHMRVAPSSSAGAKRRRAPIPSSACGVPAWSVDHVASPWRALYRHRGHPHGRAPRR